jgi:flagellar brake protein
MPQRNYDSQNTEAVEDEANPIALNLPTLEGQSDQYAIRSWREVLFYLHGILDQKLLVNVSHPRRKDFIISSVLYLDERGGEVILDSVVDHPFIRHAKPGSAIRVETSLDHIKIVFDTTITALASFDGKPAIIAQIPESLVRLQRRENFRVDLPIVKPVQCVIPATATGNPHPVSTVVLDISLGGVAICDNKHPIDAQTGDTLSQCEIALPEIGVLQVNLRVHNIVPLTARTGVKRRRIGCGFVELPNTASSTLQRYIMKLERDRRSKL